MSFLEDYGKYEHIFVFKDINSVNSDVCCQGNLYPCAYFCNVPVNLKSYCFPLTKRECLTDVQHAVILLIYIEKQALETESNKTEEERKIDEQLQNSAKLIGDLQKTQYERLSMKLPPHLAMVPGPSDAEKELGMYQCVVS